MHIGQKLGFMFIGIFEIISRVLKSSSYLTVYKKQINNFAFLIQGVPINMIIERRVFLIFNAWQRKLKKRGCTSDEFSLSACDFNFDEDIRY